MIPPNIRDALAAALGVAVQDAQPVYGGDINQTARITLADGESVFLKWNQNAGTDFFPAEAHGLQTLAAADAIRVPEVLAVSADPPFLALAWIPPASGGFDRDAMAERLGHGLAALHNTTGDAHGLDRDNYIGSLPQRNTPDGRWSAFYREMRIGAQMDIARRRGHLTRAREDGLRRLQEWLDVFLDDDAVKPSLLHGDLWSGNYMVAAGGEPVLIDPAVYYGHGEIDLAMSALFGGFPPRFYDAYAEIIPLDGFAQRRDLYQLYPLLVHLNLFGEGYGRRVDSIIRHYVG